MTAAEHYAARVDAVLAQRARLRGAEPSGDLYGNLEPDHPLLKADPRRPLDANLKALADLIEPSDAIVDVGGGAGRMSLPLALRCRSITNVDPSASMGAAFLANAKAAGISNVDLVQGDWLAADTPQGTVALVNHVTYLTRDIVPFIEKVERAGSRRVILTVNAPPPPSWNRVLFQIVHGEAEEVVPGHAELMNVLWEMGRLPDLTMLLAQNVRYIVPLPSRAAALAFAVQRVANEQWAHWPVAAAFEARTRATVEQHFDDLYAHGADNFTPRWISMGREVLITWQPGK
ncbi:MAG: class I SAM-dependent methyltransferase [Xanthobacteraceae bacterium]|nr:class I SAM-dependent methyltransferase [Xanthobacteraceae bacterium]